MGYTGDMKSNCECAYANTVEAATTPTWCVATPTTYTYKSGVAMSSSAARRAAKVTFILKVKSSVKTTSQLQTMVASGSTATTSPPHLPQSTLPPTRQLPQVQPLLLQQRLQAAAAVHPHCCHRCSPWWLPSLWPLASKFQHSGVLEWHHRTGTPFCQGEIAVPNATINPLPF